MQALNTGQNVAIKGYDLVAYFDGQAQYGDPAISCEHDGATFYFVSEENKVKFESHPEKYIPAYGGWCAYAMSEGNQFDVDPRSFKIVDGQLMLFYKGIGGDTKSIWENGDVSEVDRVQRATTNWQRN